MVTLMIEMRNGTKEDIPTLIDIWVKCFGINELNWANLFFNTTFVPQRSYLLCEAGQIMTMNYWMPCEVVLEDGRYPCAFLYAGSTLPHAQGKGYASKILHYTVNKVKELGMKYASASCVEASKRIFDKEQFMRVNRVLQICFSKSGDSSFLLQECPYEDFSKLKNDFECKNIPCISCPKETLQYLYKEANISGQILWDSNKKVYAVVNTLDESLHINETNCPVPELQQLCNAVCTYYNRKEIDVLTPENTTPPKNAISSEVIYRGHTICLDEKMPLPNSLYFAVVGD